jgi:hypothetical protein
VVIEGSQTQLITIGTKASDNTYSDVAEIAFVPEWLTGIDV